MILITQQSGNHIIGKGLAWEIMFNRVKDDNEKLDYLASFILDHSTPGGVYPETYQPNGNFQMLETKSMLLGSIMQ